MTPASRTLVHVVRHGEVDNPGRVLYGRLEGYHLSPLGEAMAQRVAESMAGRDVVHLVASPLERAQQTAAPIGAVLGLEVGSDERLIEAGNTFEGTTVGADPRQLLRWQHLRRLRNPTTPSWGEPYRDIASRMLAAVSQAREVARGHEAVLVSHQLPIETLRRTIEGRRLWHNPRARQCTLASVTTITYLGDDPVQLDYAEPAADLLPGLAPGAGT
ncbi:histidine phosphatase family protein [Ornithinimicrobium sp. F0845]|uniref:histidine phosphatase family protein n=1 Tax=Ornithinimicrobium sp. F0845 TaxID=2926412 RepID=UPI001FF106A2|nr:histidine phosphatase family protein [Ornithinimicrobium sp. F0845]MCK0113678.1 histidine phosphatase family protein [Ornithinimicrobium sp. F0845]